jgi:hypothetical protein
MKTGDTVVMSTYNYNHLHNAVCAYAGMKGMVTDVYDDGAFALDCGSSILVVPMRNAYKQPRGGVWIWLNGKHIFHKRIKTEIEKESPKPFAMKCFWWIVIFLWGVFECGYMAYFKRPSRVAIFLCEKVL